MEKLIKLLNEYKKEKKSWFTWRSIDSYDNCVYGVDCDWETEITMYSDLYSKYYWFIKWLVDNDKIDFSRDWDLAIELVNLFERKVDNADWVIALLSISDTPIEDLISYLK